MNDELITELADPFWLKDAQKEGEFFDANGFARALLSASKPAAPMGFKLVPVEPTREMMQAVRKLDYTSPTDVDWDDGYRAMLAACPAAPAQSAVPVAWFIADDNGDVYRATGYEHERDQWRAVGHEVYPLYAVPQPTQPAEGGETPCTCKGVLGHSRACALFDESMMRANPSAVVVDDERAAQPIAWFYYEDGEFIRMYESEERAEAAREKFGGDIEPVYTHPAVPAQSVEPCQIDNFSGRVCQRGTQSCVADHVIQTAVALDDEPLWDHKGNVRHDAVDRLGERQRAARTAVAQPVEQTAGDTGNPEADRIIGRLSSSDPEFDDCADAVAFIRKLVVEHKGPDGFPTWKDAAIAERMRRVNLEDAAHRYQSCRESAIKRGLFAAPDEYDAMVDSSLRKNGKEPLTGRGHNYGKKVAKDGSLYRPKSAEKTAAPCNDALFASVTDWMNAHCIPFEAQNELFRILAASATWEALFDRVALELNCLPSSFVDGNDHVFRAIEKLRAAQPVEQTQALTDAELLALIRKVEDKLGIVWFVPDDSERYAWRTTDTNERLKYARALLTAARPASGETE